MSAESYLLEVVPQTNKRLQNVMEQHNGITSFQSTINIIKKLSYK